MENSVKKIDYYDNYNVANSNLKTNENQIPEFIYVPTLANKIDCCANTSFNQTFRSPSQIFTITTPNTIYNDNTPINIDTVCYSYNLLGSTIPFSFYLNGRPYTFSFNGSPIGTCLLNLIPEALEEEITAGLTSAYKTLAILNGINSASTTQNKLNLLYSAATASAETDLLGAQTLQSLTTFEFPSPTTGTLEDFLTQIAQAEVDLATASNLLGSLAPTFAVSTSNATDFQISIAAGTGIIISLATAIINYTPTPSASAISYAQAASSNAQQAITNAATAVTTLSYPDFTAAAIDLYNAIKNAIIALALLIPSNESNSVLLAILQRIDILNNGISNTLEGLQIAYDASTSSSPLTFIQTAIEFFATNASYVIQALTFTDTTSIESLYTSFIARVNSNNNCKCNSDEPNCLFLEPISSLSICNLVITVCGTIGSQPFTAISRFENLNSLSLLGFTGINVANNLCCPCNQFSIIQNLTLNLVVNDVVPFGNYTTNASNNFSANILSTICINSDISIVERITLPAISNNTVSINCQNTI